MTSPYLSMREVAVHLRMVDADGRPSLKRAHAYVTKYGVARKKCGRSVLVVREALEASLEDR